MKLNKLLSALLVCALLVSAGSVLAVPAAAASAATSVSTQSKSKKEIEAIVTDAKKSTLRTAQEQLDAARANDYIDTFEKGDYAIYVNRYTGVMYYENKVTGQLLTSNPADITGTTLQAELLSQVELKIYEISNPGTIYSYDSLSFAAASGQISVSAMTDGLRVNYTIGKTATRYLIPGMITAQNLYKKILRPMLERYDELTGGAEDPDTYWSFEEEYALKASNEFDIDDPELDVIDLFALQAAVSRPKKDAKGKPGLSAAEKKELGELKTALIRMTSNYIVYNPAAYDKTKPADAEKIADMNKQYPITATGVAVAVLNESATANERATWANYILRWCPDYSFGELTDDEKYCGYVANKEQTPVVRLALEYSIAQDGSLEVNVPANSISYDSTVYALDSFTILKYFGAGDMSRDGYLFYPDGSGTVVKFSDFYDSFGNSSQILYTSEVYGKDFAYATITGAHCEQVTMPVFGVINEVVATDATKLLTGNDTAYNGYVCVITEGASLARLGFSSGGAQHKYASVYTTYQPYPSDEVDLTETLGVSDLNTYEMLGSDKFTGNYSFRIRMLADESVMSAVATEKYEASYVGMAAYYRDYLKGIGVLTALENVSAQLPLYIESFGSMKIDAKFLTIPIKKAVALTTFNDVAIMYSQLKNAKTGYETKAQEYRGLEASETDAEKRAEYTELALTYEALAANSENIANINFRLTGFANGGMYFTYPVKCRWEKVCGGARGLKNLLDCAKLANESGENFGIFPDFDFQYINNTATFDGIGNRGNVSRMIDNRYASKQLYNAIEREYESAFSMVISPDALNRLYSKFQKKFGKLDFTGISLSTLGSDLNSNFDKKNGINRQESEDYVSALLARVTETEGYDLMVDKGNAYTWKYASHIINASVDSSHLRFSSYTVPFFGMVLHGYANYTGNAINYAGTVSYTLLRSIENGASLFYILSYENTLNLKNDEMLNKYYGVDYETTFDDVVKYYHILNKAIGDLQTYEITDHKVLIGERVIDMGEQEANFEALKNEFLNMVLAQTEDLVNAAFATMREAGETGRGVKVVIDKDALLAQFATVLNRDVADFDAEFCAKLDEVIAYFETEYNAVFASAADPTVISVSEIVYNSEYEYVTDSDAFDPAYKKTEYTSDNGNIVIVTYSNGTQSVSFLLNYNVYTVDVRLADGTVHRLEKYGFERIG